MKSVDLFAGPGGWDLGAREIGLDPLGIEWDDAACQTREAAGLKTIQGDVAELDPLDYPCELLIASPPCQAWSMAGKRQGELDREHVNDLAVAFARGEDPPAGVEWNDERSPLAAEPMRWVHALKPRLVAFEQVPPVLELWKVCAELLREMGYSAWAGIVSAERFGVPQTRKRAILMAHLGGAIHPPMPTHQTYKPGEPRWTEPELTLEGEVLPWISMAEALGWQEGAVPTPAPTVTGGGTASGGAEVFASKGARARVSKATDGEKRVMEHQSDLGNKPRSADEPAPTIMRTVGLAKWKDGDEADEAVAHAAERRAERQGQSAEAGEEQSWPHDRPAPTIVTTRRSDKGIIVGRQLPDGEGRNVGGHGYEPEEGEYEGRVFEQRQVGARPRPVDEPAPTITSTALAQGVARWNDGDAAADKAEEFKDNRREKLAYRTNALPNATLRGEDEPAPTLVFGHASQDAGWIPEEGREEHEEKSRETRAKSKLKVGSQEKATVREEDEPAPTLLFGARKNDVSWIEEEPEPAVGPDEETEERPDWPHNRPANTVVGDERIAAGPRSERDPDYQPGDTPPSNMKNAVRVSIEEAAILQSFPPDYPWQGSRSKQFEQVGNAVPPVLATAILRALATA